MKTRTSIGAMTLVRGSGPGLCGELLGRADAHLSAAMSPGDPVERFLRAYQAALRGTGALLIVMERPRKRLADRSAWARLEKAPGFGRWAQHFRDMSVRRAQLQAGAAEAPSEEQLHRFVREVGEFLNDVEDFLRAGSQACA
jgi:hypothetical protein